MSQARPELPTWDLDSLFPGLESAQFKDTWKLLAQQLSDIQSFMQIHQIGQEGASSQRNTFDALLDKINTFGETMRPVSAYVQMRVDTDSCDTAAQAKLSELELLLLEYQKLQPRLTHWLARLDAELVQAGAYRILIDEAKVQAQTYDV